jgi:hypothetical protein
MLVTMLCDIWILGLVSPLSISSVDFKYNPTRYEFNINDVVEVLAE